MKISRRLLITATVAAVLAALAVYIAGRTPFEEQSPAVGEAAPELHLADVTGRMLSLDDLRGSVVLINFWADWCPPCMAELVWFEKVYSDYRDRGLHIVAISTGDITPGDAAGLGVSFPVAVINDRVRSSYGDVSDVPVSFLIGRDGRIIRKVRRAWPEDSLREELAAALKASD